MQGSIKREIKFKQKENMKRKHHTFSCFAQEFEQTKNCL